MYFIHIGWLLGLTVRTATEFRNSILQCEHSTIETGDVPSFYGNDELNNFKLRLFGSISLMLHFVSVYTTYRHQVCVSIYQVCFFIDTIDTSKLSNRQVNKYYIVYMQWHKQVYNVSNYRTINQFEHNNPEQHGCVYIYIYKYSCII